MALQPMFMTCSAAAGWHHWAMTDIATLGDWLGRYERAWRSNDAAEAAALFTDDAVYRFRPWDALAAGAVEGRDAIAKAWLDDPDDPAAWSMECEPLAVNGSLGIARCVTRYATTDHQPGRTYYNIFLVDLADDGRCRDFVEYFMENPKDPGLV